MVLLNFNPFSYPSHMQKCVSFFFVQNILWLSFDLTANRMDFLVCSKLFRFHVGIDIMYHVIFIWWSSDIYLVNFLAFG